MMNHRTEDTPPVIPEENPVIEAPPAIDDDDVVIRDAPIPDSEPIELDPDE